MLAMLTPLILLAQKTVVGPLLAAAPDLSWFAQWHAWYLSVATTRIGITVLVSLVIILPFLLGQSISKSLRMPDYAWKFTLVFFVLFGALAIISTSREPKRGIDLAGGTTLKYLVDKAQRPSGSGVLDKETMNKLISRIVQRVDPAGTKQVSVRKFGDDGVEIVVPEVDPAEVALLKRLINSQGHLEFRILADPQTDDAVAAQARRIDWLVKKKDADARRADADERDKYIIDEAENNKKSTEVLLGNRVAARWMDVPANETAKAAKDSDLVTRTTDGKLQKLVLIGQPVAQWFPVGNDQSGKPRVGVDREVVVRPHPGDPKKYDVLVLIDGENVEGSYLTGSRAGIGMEGPHVSFNFNAEGARRFSRLTGNNLPKQGRSRRLGIVLDGELLSAPTLHSTISDSGQITGNFTQAEVQWLVGVLDAGSLPAALEREPISQDLTNATLGDETIWYGELAIAISMIAVPLFMIMYYRFAGIVAAFALIFNLILVVAVMLALHTPFTLAGLAGLVLTVGMAVDANVLIYERMREELERGAALRMAIRNGFSRATRTIVDANVCNIITAVVMYEIGTEQLRGFAVTLFLGILMSMFTAIFCSRLVFDVFEKKRWIETLRMTKILRHTDIDFYGKMWPCLIASWVLIAIGMVAAYNRGTDFFDIDFRGGTKIQVAMKDAQDSGEVRRLLEADSNSQPKGSQLEDLTVLSVGKDKSSFDIETTQSNPKVVEAAIKRVLGPKIKTNQLHFDPQQFKMIAAPAQQPGEPGATVEPKTPAAAPPADDSKPEQRKTDPKKPEEQKPEGKKPDEKKPSEEKAGDAKATENKPEEKKTEEKKPGDKKSGVELRRGIALPQFVMFADPEKKVAAAKAVDAADKGASKKEDTQQADAAAPADKADPKGADANKKDADKKPAGGKEADAKDPPKDVKPSDAKPAEAPAAPVEAPADKPADAPLGEPAVDPAAAAEGRPPGMELAGAKESFVGGTEAQLHFDQPVNQEVLADMVQQAGVAAGLVRTQEAQKAAAEPDKGGEPDKGAAPTKAGNTPLPELNFRFKVTNPAVVGASRLPENEWTLQTTLSKEDAAKLLARMQQHLIERPTFASATNVGGQVADDMKWIGLKAVLVSFGCIVAYVWFRFQEVRFGLAAVVALVHDVLVMLGMLALSKYLAMIPGVGQFLQLESFKMNLVVLAAVLTLVGYSLNDTIVIFDRIREMRGKSPRITPKIINDSVNQTLSRTLLTSFLTFMVVFILYFVGGPGVHGFAYALLVGIIVGTYSSIYIASPILILMQRTAPAPVRSERDPSRSPAPAAG